MLLLPLLPPITQHRLYHTGNSNAHKKRVPPTLLLPTKLSTRTRITWRLVSAAYIRQCLVLELRMMDCMHWRLHTSTKQSPRLAPWSTSKPLSRTSFHTVDTPHTTSLLAIHLTTDPSLSFLNPSTTAHIGSSLHPRPSLYP